MSDQTGLYSRVVGNLTSTGLVAQVEGILEERVVPDVEIRVLVPEMGRILQECSAKEKHKLYKCFSSHILFGAPPQS